MAHIEQAFLTTLRERCGVAPDQRVLVAVSGGLDSMTLLWLLVQVRQPLTVAHVNYGLRVPAANLDEELVQTFCEEHGLPLLTERLVHFKGPNVQARAREARLAFFEQHRSRHAFLALAHHRDDVYESFFLQVLRGSGPEALLNPRMVDDWRIRPLLPFTKNELKAFAVEKGIPWREDESNAGLDYTRNKLRNLLFPALNEAIPDWKKGLDRSLENLAFFIKHPSYKEELNRRTTVRFGQPFLNLEGLDARDAAHFLLLWVQPHGHLPLEEMERWLGSQRGAEFSKGMVHLELGVNGVYHCMGPLETHANVRVEEGPTGIRITGIPRADQEWLKQQRVFLNGHALQFPLKIRRWQEGDRLEIKGGKGHKLVSDLLTDLKLPRFVKERTLVLLSGDEIAWLVGWRASKKYTIDEHAEKAYLVALD